MTPVTFYVNKTKCLLLFFVCVAITIFGIFVWYTHSVDWFKAAMVTFFFGGCTIALLWILLGEPKKMLQANKHGIYLYYYSIFEKLPPYEYLFFPWQEIKKITFRRNKKFTHLCLEITVLEALLPLQQNSAAQDALRENIFYENIFFVPYSTLMGMSLQKVVNTLHNYHAAVLANSVKE